MAQPLISIIVPIYNAERFLAASIQSILDQNYQNYECFLIIDFKSKDRSLEIADSFAAKDNRLRVIKDSQALGVANNRNIGIDLATGEYLAFLDADDTWPSNKLEKQVEFSLRNNADLSYTGFQRMSEDGLALSAPIGVPQHARYEDLLKLNFIACHTVLVKRSFVGKRRFPNTAHEDFAFWLSLLRPQPGSRQCPVAVGIDESLAFYRSVKGSRANDKKMAALWRWRILRDTEKLNIVESVYYFSQYAVRALLLHWKSKV
jgi:glycosyltransferase involved in cell wall biosynthesis